MCARACVCVYVCVCVCVRARRCAGAFVVPYGWLIAMVALVEFVCTIHYTNRLCSKWVGEWMVH